MKDIEKLLTLLKANGELMAYYEDVANKIAAYNQLQLQFAQSQLTTLNEERNAIMQRLKDKYNIEFSKLK